MTLKTEVYVDSNAALGIAKRQGCGKLRHIRIGNLWVQDKRESGEVGFQKVSGEANPADMCTKYLNRAKIQGYNRELGLREETGRAGMASKVAKGVTGEPEWETGTGEQVNFVNRRSRPKCAPEAIGYYLAKT